STTRIRAMRRAAVAALVVVVLAVPSANAGSAPQGNVLTALADIGTVYWRSECTIGQPQRWSLGVRLFDTATTAVTLQVGHRTVHRTMQPNDRRVWFGLTTAARQHIAFTQSTEPGTLRGSVSVDFGGQHSNHCRSYMPPRVSTQLYPRN